MVMVISFYLHLTCSRKDIKAAHMKHKITSI